MRITWNTNVNAPGCPGEIVPEQGELGAALGEVNWDEIANGWLEECEGYEFKQYPQDLDEA